MYLGYSFTALMSADQPNILTPYMLLNLRNYVNQGLAYFVVLARNESDISKSVIFAASHNIAISVMSTGHEFQVQLKSQLTNLLSSIRSLVTSSCKDATKHPKHI